MTPLTDYQEARERVEKLAAHREEAASEHRKRANEAGLGTPSMFWSDAARACENDAAALRILLSGPPVTAEEIARVLFRAEFTGPEWSDHNWPRDVHRGADASHAAFCSAYQRRQVRASARHWKAAP